MDHLTVDHTWAKQLDVIRNRHSDPTELVRSGAATYRTCRNNAQVFTILLAPTTQGHSAPLELKVSEHNFYIYELGKHRMERYSSLIKTDRSSASKFQVSAWRLDSAIHDLIGDDNPKSQFENLTLLTFCVAESLRSDTLAQEIGDTIGAHRQMDIQDWVRRVRDWGTTSSQIRQGLAVQPELKAYAAAISVLCL